VCPVAVRQVWDREIKKFASRPIDIVVLDKGTTADKAVKMITAIGGRKYTDRPLVVIVNYESAWRSTLGTHILNTKWDFVIADEAHRYSAHDSAVGKFMGKMHYKAKYRLALTGTPLPHSPLNAFGLFRFIDPGLFGTSWFEFSNRYAEKRNPNIPQQITGYKNLDQLQNKFQLLTYQCRASDVLDLPPVTHETLLCELSPAGKKHYNELENEMITEVKAAGGTDGVCSVPNALVKLLRLAQVCSGFLKLDDDAPLVEIDSEKLDMLRDFLEDLPKTEPVVVFCRFKYDLKRLKELAAKLGRKYGELSGDCKDALDDKAMLKDGIQFAAVQISAGGVGIDLTRSAYGFYYSQGLSLAEFDQSVARLHRPGQTRHTHFYHLCVQGSVDERIYKAFDERREIIDSVLRGYVE